MALRGCLCELIKNVEVSLVQNLTNHPRFFKEIVVDVGANGLTLRIELYLQVLSEARRVVVAQRFGISKRLQQRICCKNHVFNLLDGGVGTTRDVRNILHYALCSLCLAGARLTRDDYALVFGVRFHVVVRGLGDGKNVWRHFQTVLPPVTVKHCVGVYAQVLEGIDRDQHMANVGVYLGILEALLQVIVNGLVGYLADEREV